jgi:hypothetical protein
MEQTRRLDRGVPGVNDLEVGATLLCIARRPKHRPPARLRAIHAHHYPGGSGVRGATLPALGSGNDCRAAGMDSALLRHRSEEQSGEAATAPIADDEHVGVP